jgi:hypothetical protein
MLNVTNYCVISLLEFSASLPDNSDAVLKKMWMIWTTGKGIINGGRSRVSPGWSSITVEWNMDEAIVKDSPTMTRLQSQVHRTDLHRPLVCLGGILDSVTSQMTSTVGPDE